MARTVLPIAGAIVGSFFGAPQLGYAIGSVIGNAVDPQRIKGPRIGDVNLQTSQEGAPRPIVYGTAAVMGNLIDRGPLNKVITEERQGKGGGPVVENESLFMTFAIRICEGPIDGVSRIWEDERLVYDMRPESTIVDDSLKYAQGFTLYLGSEDQLPDPDLEVIHGIGNTPAHRGTAYIVFTEKNLTDRRGSIPQFRFEVNGCLVDLVGGGGDPGGSITWLESSTAGAAVQEWRVQVPLGSEVDDLFVLYSIASRNSSTATSFFTPADDDARGLDGDVGSYAAGNFVAVCVRATADSVANGIRVALPSGFPDSFGNFLVYRIPKALYFFGSGFVAALDSSEQTVVVPGSPVQAPAVVTLYPGSTCIVFSSVFGSNEVAYGSYPLPNGNVEVNSPSGRLRVCFQVVANDSPITTGEWTVSNTPPTQFVHVGANAIRGAS
jgi:hypothetical protein